MTDLIPPPVTARVRVPLLDPATVLDEDATASVDLAVDLGPDWSALRAFAAIVAALTVASLVGHRVAGPFGVVITAGLVALVLFVVAHIRAWALGRRLDRTAATAVDTYASTGTGGNRSAATGPTGYAWRCDVCRVVSIEASTRPEVVDLAGTHDRLHHGRPTAAVLALAATPGAARVSMLSTREGL